MIPHFCCVLFVKSKSLCPGGGDLVTKSRPTFAIPWTVAHPAPLSTGFPSQEYWSGLPVPSPWDLPDPRIKPRSSVLQADSLLTELPGEPHPHPPHVLPTLKRRRLYKGMNTIGGDHQEPS